VLACFCRCSAHDCAKKRKRFLKHDTSCIASHRIASVAKSSAGSFSTFFHYLKVLLIIEKAKSHRCQPNKSNHLYTRLYSSVQKKQYSLTTAHCTMSNQLIRQGPTVFGARSSLIAGGHHRLAVHGSPFSFSYAYAYAYAYASTSQSATHNIGRQQYSSSSIIASQLPNNNNSSSSKYIYSSLGSFGDPTDPSKKAWQANNDEDIQRVTQNAIVSLSSILLFRFKQNKAKQARNIKLYLSSATVCYYHTVVSSLVFQPLTKAFFVFYCTLLALFLLGRFMS
jgi:hypothetical protein